MCVFVFRMAAVCTWQVQVQGCGVKREGRGGAAVEGKWVVVFTY